MGCGPSSEAGATGASTNASASKSSSVAGANAGKKFGDSYKLGKEASVLVVCACVVVARYSAVCPNLGCC
jgi:hypothetical protein